MSDKNLFKKALGVFVDFDESKQEAVHPEAAEAPAAPAPVLEDVPDDLGQNPDVQQVREAIKLLGSLPLDGIPVEKARELIARTLKFAGMETADLLASFQRAQGLYQAQIQNEQARIAARQQQDLEILRKLEEAIAMEKEQCAAEVAERNRRIEQSTAELLDLEKALGFFAPKQEGQA